MLTHTHTQTHTHTNTHTHRQNDYRTLPPTLRGEGNKGQLIIYLVEIITVVMILYGEIFLPLLWGSVGMSVANSSHNKSYKC